MARVRWTPAAREDLHQIQRFISRGSPRYAAITIRRISAAAVRLRQFPSSGRVVPESPQGPYRELIVDSYRLIYRYEQVADLVVVVAILHGSRDMPSELADA